MRPIVEYSGRAHLVSTWKVDTLTWKYSNRQVTYDRILPFSRYAQFSQFFIWTKYKYSASLQFQLLRTQGDVSIASGSGKKHLETALLKGIGQLHAKHLQTKESRDWRGFGNESTPAWETGRLSHTGGGKGELWSWPKVRDGLVKSVIPSHLLYAVQGAFSQIFIEGT